MGSKIKLLKRVMLSSIGIYLGLLFSKMHIQPTGYHLLSQPILEQFILRIIICSIALWYYLHLQAQKERPPTIRTYPNGYTLTIGTILAQLMMTFALALLSSIQAALGYPPLQPPLDFSNKIDFLYRGIIAISCLTAILEELLFRGILEQLLYKIIRSRPWITVISALAFSLMHCNMQNNLLYFVMGCFLSYLYHQTKHIIYPIIAHGLHNLCATAIMYLTLDKSLDLSINGLTIGTRIVLTIGLLVAVYKYVTLMGQKTQKNH